MRCVKRRIKEEVEGRSADKEEIRGSEISPLLTSISPHSFVGLPSAFRGGVRGGFQGLLPGEEEDGEKMMERTETKAAAAGGRKRGDGGGEGGGGGETESHAVARLG